MKGRKQKKGKNVEMEEEKRDSIYEPLLQNKNENKTKIARMSQVAWIYLGTFRGGNQQYHMDNQASLH